jgi:hypothetical protein
MATQNYVPQPYAPPQAMPARAGEKFNPMVGLPEIVALQFDLGKMVQSSITGDSQVMFTLTDGRRWFVAIPVADQIRALGIVARQQFEVIKNKPRSGGPQFTITPLDAHLGTGRAPAPVQSAPPPPPPSQQAPAGPTGNQADPPLRAHDANAISPAAACMCAAMCAAVDAVIETQAYARAKGLGVTFGEESVRAIGLSIYISGCKGGAR